MVTRIYYDFDTKYSRDNLKTVNIEEDIVVPGNLSESAAADNLENNEEQSCNKETTNAHQIPTQRVHLLILIWKVSFCFWTISK